ncbi:MAG: cupin domain-containing protein [Chloroflexota bacterium]
MSPNVKKRGLEVIDFLAIAQAGGERKPAWGLQTEDLNLNLVVLEEGGGIAEHTNDEVDVLIAGIAGEGQIIVEEGSYPMRAGQAMVLPKGTPRSIGCAGNRFVYLTCHRRRSGIWPQGLSRPEAHSGR